MTEDEMMKDDATDARTGGGQSGSRSSPEGGVGAASGAEIRGGDDPASTGEGGQSHGEGRGRSGDWDPGLIRGGGELY